MQQGRFRLARVLPMPDAGSPSTPVLTSEPGTGSDTPQSADPALSSADAAATASSEAQTSRVNVRPVPCVSAQLFMRT